MPDDPLVPIQAGDTFIMGTGGHLWIVLSDPSKNCGSFVMTNLTSDRRRSGSDCELNVGDHPWISHKCYVSFGDAREVNQEQASDIQRFMKVGSIEKQFPLEPKILQRIVSAAKVSTALTIALKKYF